MKELEKTIQDNQDKIEIVGQKEQATQLNFLGSTKLQKGHQTFEINIAENTITPAEYESYGILDKNKIGGVRPTRKIVVKQGCYYINALNKKNAMKGFIKMLQNRQ